MPIIWREPTDHVTDCYFCMVLPLQHKISKKKKWTVTYPNILSGLRPIQYREDSPVPQPPKKYDLESDHEEKDSVRGLSQALWFQLPRL